MGITGELVSKVSPLATQDLADRRSFCLPLTKVRFQASKGLADLATKESGYRHARLPGKAQYNNQQDHSKYTGSVHIQSLAKHDGKEYVERK